MCAEDTYRVFLGTEPSFEKRVHTDTSLMPIMSRAFWNTFHPIVSCVPKVAPELFLGVAQSASKLPASLL